MMAAAQKGWDAPEEDETAVKDIHSLVDHLEASSVTLYR